MKRKSKPVKGPRMRGNIATIPSPKQRKKMDILKDTSPNKHSYDNKLYYGDNLEILRRHIKDETVDLCYIDPPFNSKRNYNQIYNNIGREDRAQAQAFVDTWTWDSDAEIGLDEIRSNYNGAFTHQSIDLINGLLKVLGKGSLLAYLVHMTLRIAEIYRVLKPMGSFYLHCDPSSSHYLKIIIDSVFCAQTGIYQNEIVWKRTSAHSDSETMGNSHDVILFYTKSENFIWNKQYQKYDDSYINSHYRKRDDKGRLFRTDNLTAMGLSGGGYTYEWNGITKLWRCPKEKMNELHESGRIRYTRNGTAEFIRYLDEMPGMPLQDVWTDISPVNSQATERLGYPTQKPETLLERIIKTSSNEGDVILDAYCGCGTTVAVAERLNRRWIGIDITYQSISLILRRLQKHFGISTIKNIEIMGVPKDFEAAQALAHKENDKTRKEFEKWAVLTYSENRATINEKKGGDRGIDGVAYLPDYDERGKQDSKQILFSVKSDKTLTTEKIRELFGTVVRENAAVGIMITLYPMPNLVKESKKYGLYKNEVIGQTYPKIQVISIQEMLLGATIKMPLVLDVVKDAQPKSKNKQQVLEF